LRLILKKVYSFQLFETQEISQSLGLLDILQTLQNELDQAKFHLMNSVAVRLLSPTQEVVVHCLTPQLSINLKLPSLVLVQL
jgi:hypothetical protein